MLMYTARSGGGVEELRVTGAREFSKREMKTPTNNGQRNNTPLGHRRDRYTYHWCTITPTTEAPLTRGCGREEKELIANDDARFLPCVPAEEV